MTTVMDDVVGCERKVLRNFSEDSLRTVAMGDVFVRRRRRDVEDAMRSTMTR